MDWIKKADGEFQAQAADVVPALIAAPVAVGLVAADVDGLAALRTAFNNALAAANAAKAELANLVAAKEVARTALANALRDIGKRVKANSSVTDDARRAAFLPVPDRIRSVNAPIVVAQLVATEDGATAAKIAFNSNGNTSGIRYRVEKRVGSAVGWELVDVITATKLRVVGLPPGVRVDFRVLSQRGEVLSEPSSVSSVNA
jgi:Flp pilus assembly pilin Flp